MPEAVHVHLPEELHEGSHHPSRTASGSSSSARSCCCRSRRYASPGAATRRPNGAGSRPAGTRRRAARTLANRAVDARGPGAAPGPDQLQPVARADDPADPSKPRAGRALQPPVPARVPARVQAWLAQAPMGDLQAAENDTSYASTRRRTRPSTPTTTSSARCSSPRCSSSPPSRCASSGCRCE